MKPENYDERLADYLGDEMSPTDRAAFEADLAAAPECAAEVAELKATLAELRQLSPFEADATVLPLASKQPVRRAAGTVFKAAAVLAFGMFMGRLTAPAANPPNSRAMQAEPPANIETSPKLATIHPAWIEFGRKLGAGSSSFGAGFSSEVGVPR